MHVYCVINVGVLCVLRTVDSSHFVSHFIYFMFEFLPLFLLLFNALLGLLSYSAGCTHALSSCSFQRI